VRLYSDGLAAVLGRVSELDVVATVATAAEALAAVRRRPCDIVLIDVSLPNGVELVARLPAAAPSTRALAVALREHEDDVMPWAEAGVAGYVPQEASFADLVAAINSVARGESLCSPRIAGALLRRVAALAADASRPAPGSRLTAREAEVVGLIEQGLSNKEIAGRLSITTSTVKNHVHSILEKLAVSRRADAARRVRRIDPIAVDRPRYPSRI
jgi:DNA-binding NarL/FixJ family response regulator